MDILVDDLRNIEVDLIARNYVTAIKVLAYFSGDIDWLYLDHDLGEERTGYDVIMFAIKAKLILPRKVILVTSNPVGRDNIAKALINDAGYSTINGTTFSRIS